MKKNAQKHTYENRVNMYSTYTWSKRFSTR